MVYILKCVGLIYFNKNFFLGFNEFFFFFITVGIICWYVRVWDVMWVKVLFLRYYD